MEEDGNLRELLKYSAEVASTGFTKSVMNSVKDIALAKQYQPLINEKLKKAFVFFYLGIVSFILLLCIIIGIESLPIGKIAVPSLTADVYRKVILFVLIFWVVFAVNAWVTKHRLKSNQSAALTVSLHNLP